MNLCIVNRFSAHFNCQMYEYTVSKISTEYLPNFLKKGAYEYEILARYQ